MKDDLLAVFRASFFCPMLWLLRV